MATLSNDANIAPGVTLYEEVLEVLPEDIKITAATPSGISVWSKTVKIDAVKRDGTPARYFLKYVMKEHGEPQLKGEYTGMLEIYNTVPHMAPKPYGWGRVASEPCVFFYVCDFIPLAMGMPDPAKLARLVADMHKKSVSPTGKFGFYLPTHDGWQPQDVGQWDGSWASCFSRLLKGLWKLDAEVHGRWEELDVAMETTLNKVIPRLIGILERDGRKIKPCLIHGDLWETNIGTHIETGDIYIFDAAAYYAHNEMEIGIWRVDHHLMRDKVYREKYAKIFSKSDPAEEWDDRLKLYGVKTKLMYSASMDDGVQKRPAILKDLQNLIEIYGKGD